MRRFLGPLLLLVLALPLGCALATGPGADDDLAGLLSTDRSRYSHGETALVRLTNRTDQRLGYNLCSSARELRTGSGWRRIEPLRLCVGALFVLEEGESAVHEEPITEEWPEVRYRMVTTVERMDSGDRVEVRSDEFTVETP